MKFFFTILLTVGLLFASGPSGGVALSVAATASEYQAVPPFVSAGVPPLVMLVMGRNHKLYYEAYNDASDLNEDGELDVGYNPDIDYYGYFDSYKCYTCNSTSSRFEPSVTTTNKKCSGANEWSGDFLNYLTMTRMDCLRKVLYGGHRSTDTATETVLQRVYVPQDAHSWGKEYESIERDGYDISEYTPLNLPAGPTGATRHLFVNTTLSEAGDPLLRVLENSVYRIWDWVACEVPVAGDRVIDGQTGPLVTDNGSSSGLDVTESGSAGTITDSGFGTPSAEQPLKAFDDDINSKWLTWGASTSGSWQDIWIQFQFDSPKKILKYTLTTGDDAEGRDPKAWKLQASNNGTDWIDVDTVSDGALPSGRKQKKEFTCDNPPSEDYIYYRLYITEKKNMTDTSDCSSNWCVQITEIEMMETTDPIPATATLTDYPVRVKVCDPSMIESNCRLYPSGVYKPIGILQRRGESDRIYFGLITGSYTKNTSGGVLRKNIGSITDEIAPDTGQLTSTDGIIKTIDDLRIVGFDYGSHSYNQNCGWVTTSPISEGQCRMWGNPIGEMMYEGLRYFAGKGAPTGDFTYGLESNDDNNLGLPLPAWQDPYDAVSGFDYCSKSFMLVLSDINPTYDSDQLPGSYFGSFTGDLSGLDVESRADTICSDEGDTGSHFIGQNDSTYDGACSEKDVTGFGDIRGLCPEEPTKQGSYYAASVAYFGRTEDMSDANSSQNVNTYAVGLASPLPRINIPVGNGSMTLVPFAKSVGGSGISATQGNFQPTNTIVDFFVEMITPTYGKFRINFEDVEQGADHDMDAIVEYEYQVNGTSVDITLNSKYAAGGIIQHIGYIISGTTADGTYLEVRDWDTLSGSDPDYFLDTPAGEDPGGNWNDGNALPLNTTRTFTVGDNPAATLLKNPLWYAAKWGGFEDNNDNDKPDLESEWDKDMDGVPDTYFYVTNPLRLEEQLNNSFTDMLNRVSSGSAASVISNSRSGAGAIYQSIFFPEYRGSLGNTVNWIGNTHTLFVDDYGNMHEDTVRDATLDVDNDYVIEFDGDTGKVKRYDYDPMDKSKTFVDEIEITDIKFVWDALSWLSDPSMDVTTQRIYTWNADQRYIFTDDIDTGANVTTNNVDNTNIMDFTTGFVDDPDHNNYYFLNPYLTYDHDGDPATPVVGLTEDEMITEAQNIIRFVRGEEGLSETGTGRPYPNRTLDINGTKVFRLGDIIHSTPTVVSQPSEAYDLLYGDDSYREFRKDYLNRRTVVYTGANDGMLHAFNGGFYDAGAHKFCTQFSANSTDYELGFELWAYVPNALLPHLKWLKESVDYNTHVYYVDLKPRIFDATIFSEDADHPNGWGTVLVGGMRLGGKPIGVDTTTDGSGDPAPDGTDDLFFWSTFFALDITNPEEPPSLLWSFNDVDLGFTTSYLTPIRVGSKWFVVIGSGPDNYEATHNTAYGGSNGTAKVYILNADDGTLAREFSMDSHSFMAAPIAADFDLATTIDGNDDTLWTGEAIYIASDGCGA
ncbi:MAG: discoidin domain-containing protein [Deltaproteobacteria bacterium]|nr:discoidin domain-containing protein [Deltaproteobacteria bacterium]MBW1937731.1 discoidin domain-containing protein [Deltaproteobacteria bacterium]MBW1963934.1 discoidin domain-containing protein [Deltaproteobacteria bacterium]